MTASIMVIDDDPETLKMINMILNKEGFLLTVTHSGKDGLALAKVSPPDLLLLDVMMPGMDGYEVCREFRSDPNLAHVPIMLFTAKNKPQDKHMGFQAGADDFLTKPTNPKELVDRVQMLLARSSVSPNKTGMIDALSDAGKPPMHPDKMPNKKAFIGVMGTRGGAGATTVAINLAGGIAQTKKQTILVDFDLLQGHIAQYLNLQAGKGVHQIAKLSVNELDINKLLTPYKENLETLLTASNIIGKRENPTSDQIAHLLKALKEDKRTIIADLGTGISPLNQSILPFITQLVLCVTPERISINTAQRMVNDLRNSLPDTAIIHLVMASFNPNIALPREAIEGSLRYPLLEIVTIPPKELARVANKGETFVFSKPDSPISQAFRSMAHQLVSI